MGEAALAREFKQRPPREPLTSITALWRDYMHRYVNAGRQDPALYWTMKAPNIQEAIRRACDSRGEDGKLFFHQGRVWQVNRDALAKYMLKDEKHYHSYSECKSFHEVYQLLEEAKDNVKGIGIVTAYDVTDRIASYLGLEPQYLYFHAGVREGLAALGVDVPSGREYVRRDELPEFFEEKNLGLVESFLCGYRSEVERVMKGKKAKKKNRKKGKR